MSSPKFAETHNVVAFFEKPVESDGFAEIIDFLKASSVHYALTVNPIIYTSCIEQFWATAKVQTVNGVRQLQALVDKKKVIITESSIRSDLHLDDAEGTDCQPTATIFEELASMGAKSTAWNEFSSIMASLIICLATNQKFNLSKYIFDAMVKHLDRGVKFLMYPRFLLVFINQQLGDMSQHKKIFVNPFHTKKVFANIKRAGKDFSGRITPLFDTMMVQASKEVGEDSDHPTDSNQIPIRKEAVVPQDETEESVSTASNNPQPSGCSSKGDCYFEEEGPEVGNEEEVKNYRFEETKESCMSRRVESSEDHESLGDHADASKQGRSIEDIDADVDVTLVDETQERQDEDLMFDTGVLDSDEMPVEAKIDEKNDAAPTIPTTVEETLAQTLMEIKATKPKAKGIVFHDQEEQPEVPLKRKDQVALDEQMARDVQAQLEAEIIEKENLARKQEEEANIALIESWDNTQAMIEADFELAQRLQTEEQGEITIEERSRLFVELMNKRKKHFAMLRAEEKRRKPPTNA
ncbi:hypothetical protein Tco_1365645 [Tanacetum coccineum]